MQNTAAEETRTALLTITLASKARFTAAYEAANVTFAQRDARTFASLGVAVSLKWLAADIMSDPDQIVNSAVTTALAAFARDDRFNQDTVVGYRVILNPHGETVIWLMIESSSRKGRGYLLSWHRGMEILAVVSGAPTTGLYMWGFSRLRAVEPCEGAVMVYDWTDI